MTIKRKILLVQLVNSGTSNSLTPTSLQDAIEVTITAALNKLLEYIFMDIRDNTYCSKPHIVTGSFLC